MIAHVKNFLALTAWVCDKHTVTGGNASGEGLVRKENEMASIERVRQAASALLVLPPEGRAAFWLEGYLDADDVRLAKAREALRHARRREARARAKRESR